MGAGVLTPSNDSELLTQARKIMSPIVEDLARHDEIQAICVLSSAAVNGLTQTPFDEESDFDLAIILDIPLKASQWHPRPHDTYALIADQIPQWVPPFLFYMDVPWGRMEINVNQLIYQYEADPRTTWAGEKCDVYSRKAEILLDHGGAFGRVIQQKNQQARSLLQTERRRLANRVTWDIREMPLRQANRYDPVIGHHVLNLAVEEVIELLYVANDRFIPNRKWKVRQLTELVTPEAFALLGEALRCDLSEADLTRRVEALERFCDAVGVVYEGPAAAIARSDHQAMIQLRPFPTWRDLETVGAHPYEHDLSSVPVPCTLDQWPWISQRKPT